ncbi:hypothetical protein NZK35_08790 [Stieleria sp. ICT_E10.1]|uniref:hypothetical protein n=1 Tax=Stieleria sedimenti TaxID=2976331 RepID=UPI00217FA578|nr:hypothetical protein [Stieleria sedimenti]MCS7466737.1 hypothetical protein [Stieleria sedimenti]
MFRQSTHQVIDLIDGGVDEDDLGRLLRCSDVRRVNVSRGDFCDSGFTANIADRRAAIGRQHHPLLQGGDAPLSLIS